MARRKTDKWVYVLSERRPGEEWITIGVFASHEAAAAFAAVPYCPPDDYESRIEPFTVIS